MIDLIAQAELELTQSIADYYDDPLGGVLFLFPWGESGTPLEYSPGPNREQAAFLKDLGAEIRARKFAGIDAVPSIRMAVSSGHGTGKTELIGMLACWLMATRDAMRGTVTANTGVQLETKTWASIQKYKKLMICAHWFEITSEKFWRVGRKEDWFFQAQTCAEENADSFQGQHAKTSSSVYIFDEDSNVPQTIHTAAEGGTVHGESMWFVFGNPTRREGAFYDICFGNKLATWLRHTLGASKDTIAPSGFRRWDARYTEYKNQQQIDEWTEEYGEDSDFVRVRVHGLPPNAGDLQFIPQTLIEQAARRKVSIPMMDEPIIAGCDLSWGGDDPCTIRYRCGSDARSVPKVSVPGAQTKDDAVMIMKISEVMTKSYPQWGNRKVDMMFIDSAGSCGNICRRLREMGITNVIEVNFGGHAPTTKYKLMRSYMWGQVKEALPYLAIDASPDLNADLGAPGYKITGQSEILLEQKQFIIKRIGHSTDDGDALALTYAMPVKSTNAEKARRARMRPKRYIGAYT